MPCRPAWATTKYEVDAVLLDRDEGEDLLVEVLADNLARVEEGELHEEGEPAELSAGLLDQLCAGDGGAAGCHEVVHHEDLVAGLESVAMDLQLVGAILEGI